jgi:hypothetical protein
LCSWLHFATDFSSLGPGCRQERAKASKRNDADPRARLMLGGEFPTTISSSTDGSGI